MTVYKFYGPDLLDFFDNQLVRFTPPLDFNDPFEFLADFRSLAHPDEYLQKIFENDERLDWIVWETQSLLAHRGKFWTEQEVRTYIKNNVDKYVDQSAQLGKLWADSGAQERFQQWTGNKYGILCLCDIKHRIKMWSHYAKNHTGFVIGFDATHSFFNQEGHSGEYIGTLTAVNYGDRPSGTVTDLDDEAIYFTKSSEWEYEQEKRMLLPLEECDQKNDIADQEHDIHLFKVPTDAVEEITLGQNISNETQCGLLSKIDSYHKWDHLEIHRSRLSKNAYELEFEKIR